VELSGAHAFAVDSVWPGGTSDANLIEGGYFFLVTPQDGIDHFTLLNASFKEGVARVHVPAFRTKASIRFILRIGGEKSHLNTEVVKDMYLKVII
jgi:hypothetical protein